jgi:FkbM family methyltransferase
MKQILYRIIYQPWVNRILRHSQRALKPIWKPHHWLPVNGILKLKIGAVKMQLATNQTSHLCKLIFWEGAENFEYTRIFLGLAPKADVFWDIGSNIGYYSLLASKLKPSMKVVAFEPARGPRHYLEKNIALNAPDIECVPVALSDKQGRLTFYEVTNPKYKFIKYNLAGEGHAGSHISDRNFMAHEVAADTVDHFFSQQNYRVDLVKIDTEGTEDRILSQAHEMLEKCEPIIICETLFNTIEDKLEALLKPKGYAFYNHVGSKLIKVDSLVREEDDGVRNCFFVPPSKRSWIAPFVEA